MDEEKKIEESKPIEMPEKLQTDDEKPEEAPPPAQSTAPTKPKKRGHFWIILVLIVLILALAGYIVYGQYGDQIKSKLGISSDKSSSSSGSSESAKKTDDTATTTATVTKVVDDGVTWQTPVKLADLGLFNIIPSCDGPGCYSGGAAYYQVGKTDTGGTIIVAEVQTTNTNIFRFVKRADVYYLLSKNSAVLEYSAYDVGKIQTDSTFILKSLLPDKILSKGETQLIYQQDGNIETETGYTAGKVIQQTNWGGLYLETGKAFADSNSTASTARYYISLNDSTKAYYDSQPTFLRDDKTFNATFTDPAKAKLTFDKMKTSGCGFGISTFPLAAATALGAKVQIATSTAGSKLYSFTSATDPLAKYAYSTYLPGQDTVKPISQFLSDYGIVIWIDDYGNAIIYTNSNYTPMAECGKPVIYLYPTTPTQVTIKVGANITKSDPVYNGLWTAFARPSGQLTVAGKNYDSLFWEGLGWGEYPQITSGAVIETARVGEKINADLSKIGLNPKEIADFSDFWLPKMPKTKYTRLTWLLNDDMNKLAPLTVSPKPDSVIRVFLDFAGQDQLSDITPQTLPTLKRDGFALVEWGGLLVK